MSVIDRADRSQPQHRWLGFPFAVYKKFGDDRAGARASLLAYYAFFSIFPLMLVAVTVLGFALHSHPTLEAHAFSSVLNLFPIIGQEDPVHPLTGNVFALSSVRCWLYGRGCRSPAKRKPCSTFCTTCRAKNGRAWCLACCAAWKPLWSAAPGFCSPR